MLRNLTSNRRCNVGRYECDAFSSQVDPKGLFLTLKLYQVLVNLLILGYVWIHCTMQAESGTPHWNQLSQPMYKIDCQLYGIPRNSVQNVFFHLWELCNLFHISEVVWLLIVAGHMGHEGSKAQYVIQQTLHKHVEPISWLLGVRRERILSMLALFPGVFPDWSGQHGE